MPKNIVPSPTAAVSVDRLTLNAADARDAVGAHASVGGWLCCQVCFSEE